MVSLQWQKFKAMYKKDWLIRRRHYVVTFFELFFPIVMIGVHLYSIREPVQSPSLSSRTQRSSPVQMISKSSLAAPIEMLANVHYYSYSFYCSAYGTKIFYSLSSKNFTDFIESANEKCGFETIPLTDDQEVVKLWGDNVENELFVRNTALFFHKLDLVNGIANYSIGSGSFDYSGPWTESLVVPFSGYIDTQSVINQLLSFYPDYSKVQSVNFRYDFTSNLFEEGNPQSDNIKTDVQSDETMGPVAPFKVTDFYQGYAFIEIGFLYLSTVITLRVLKEKVTNSNELLRIMGLDDLIYWTSHFINYFTLSVFHGSMITLIYTISSKNPYPGWNGGVFWFNYLVNSVTNILLTFTFTTVLSRPNVGVLVVLVARVVLAYVPFAAKTASLSISWISPKVLSCLLPSGQLHFSIYDMFYFGQIKTKVSFSNIFDSIAIDDTVNFSTIYLVTIVSWPLYIVLTYYVDKVWPWQKGTPKPWHFPVSQFFKRPLRDGSITGSAFDMDSLQSDNNKNNNYLTNLEPDPGNLRPNIECVNLYKSFGSGGGKKFAVDGINLNILKGQITVLLGHNGAGKTTTMSMITGILTPSSGNIYVNGIDVHKDTVAARRCLALCPQHDLLFEELTVKENLNLCAGLRGLSDQIKKNLIPLNIKRVNLEEKANTLASNLSGGMRRRLQLALALSTASEILILDEPTSGLDPESRRQLWDLLLELRKDLTILLTTHFMEEADALGDRIVIMGSGKVKCSGSPMFLKKRLGTGYSIRAAKDTLSYEANRLSNQIKSHFPKAEISAETNEEVIYQLNTGSDQDSTSSLADLCDTLDKNLTSLGVTSYGIVVTTLEDVFLKVAEDEEKPSTVITVEDKLFELNKILDYSKLTGLSLITQRFRGLVMKRFHYTKRHYKTIGFTIILPAIVTLFTFHAARNASGIVGIKSQGYPNPIPLDVKAIYGSNAKAVIRASFTGSSSFIDSYRQIMRESGIQVIEIRSSLSMNDYFNSSSQNREQFMNENIFGIIEDPSRPRGFAAWLNPKATLSLPLSITAWQNALIRNLGNGRRNGSKVTITYKAMPNRYTIEPKYKAIVAQIISAIFSPVAFCLIAVSYFLFPSTESQNKCNLIQKMNGIRAPMFWFSHYAFDLTYHLIVTIIIFLAIIVIDSFPFVTFKVTASILILLILYGLASIPLFYLFSFLPLTPDRGFSLLSTFSLVGTLIGSGIAASLMAFDKVKSLHVILGDLFPPFAASFGLSKIYGVVTLNLECKAIDACPNGNKLSKEYCCTSDEKYIQFSPFSFKDGGILTEIIMLMVDSILYTLILIVLDENLHRLGYWYETIRKKLSSEGESVAIVEDEDVTRERERIKQLIASNRLETEALIVDELNKDFGSFKAVDKITFGVHKAECFGLLGVNGAGKTTTFRMLTGDIMVTSGDAYVGSYSLRKDLLNFQQSISYCPQFDALLDNLTPVESLTLFARIRGMPEDKVKANVNYIIESTDLTRFRDTLNQNLSGGNKRKLSLAIASIAKPEVMFLDEPTTGVDPASRRKIWSTLIHLRDTSGSSIVLTSHSMDECEALCSRIGIMARGSFKCLGSSQHLKEKFGLGFTLIIKIKDLHSMDMVQKFIREKFPSSILRDVHQTILHYHITDTSIRWGKMLRCLDEGKRSLPIEDFTLTGTTLEQIFLSFAKQT